MERPGKEFDDDAIGRLNDDIKEGIYYPMFGREWREYRRKTLGKPKTRRKKSQEEKPTAPEGATHFIPPNKLFHLYPPSNNSQLDIAYQSEEIVFVRDGEQLRMEGHPYRAYVVVPEGQEPALATSLDGNRQHPLINGHPLYIPPINYVKIG